MYVAIKKIYDKRTDRVNEIYVYKYILEWYFSFKKKLIKIEIIYFIWAMGTLKSRDFIEFNIYLLFKEIFI